MKLGKRIAALRTAAGLTQQDLALACGWESQSRLGNYEQEKREPSLQDLLAIYKATGPHSERTVTWLAFGDDAPTLSQPVRYDPETLGDAMALLDDLDVIQGRRPEQRPDPTRLALACEAVVAFMADEDGPSVVVLLAERLRKTEGKNNGVETGKDKGIGDAVGGTSGATREAKPARRRAR